MDPETPNTAPDSAAALPSTPETPNTPAPSAEPSTPATPETPATPSTPSGEPKPTMLDAINEAIEDVSPKRRAEPVDEATAGEGESTTPAAGETPKAPTAEPGTAQAPAEPAKPEGTPAPDHVNDPIPAEVRGRTRERMTSLIASVKSLTTERDQYQHDRDDLLGMVSETRASPEQFGAMLDYLRAVNSGDPQQIRGAIATAQQELAGLAQRLGEPVAGVDLTGMHQDLRAAVASGELSAEHAQEIAAARALRATQARAGQQAQQMSQANTAIAQGREALNTLETQLKAADPLYQRKRDLLVPMLQGVFAELPPAKWAAAFKAAYEKMVLPAAAPIPSNGNGASAPNPLTRARSYPQPLRTQQPAGAAARQPSSMLEAINAGIEQASRH